MALGPCVILRTAPARRYDLGFDARSTESKDRNDQLLIFSEPCLIGFAVGLNSKHYYRT